MRIRSSVLRQVVPVVVGVGAILAGSAGLAHAADIVQPDKINFVQPDKISDPGPCGWSVHWQTGNCVDVETPAIPFGPPPSDPLKNWRIDASFLCPTDYPYPYLGALSQNPTWLDRSYQANAVVRPIAAEPYEDNQSFAGGDYNSWWDTTEFGIGYVTVRAESNIFASGDAFAQGRYQCSDTPAK